MEVKEQTKYEIILTPEEEHIIAKASSLLNTLHGEMESKGCTEFTYTSYSDRLTGSRKDIASAWNTLTNVRFIKSIDK